MSDDPAVGRPAGAPAPPAWLAQLVTSCADGTVRGILPERRPPRADGTDDDGRPVRDSAVLVLVSGSPDAPGPTPPAEASILLTHRAASLRSHSGQLAFPGGRADEGDGGPVGTALREAVEETGLDPAGVEVQAVAHPLYIPASHYSVYPVLGYWRTPSPVGVVDTAETARVWEVPLETLLDPANRFVVEFSGGGWRGPAFRIEDLVLWGFTAGVLAAMLRAAGWERDWDTGDVRELESTLAASANGEPYWGRG